jgi:hypothetical protein
LISQSRGLGDVYKRQTLQAPKNQVLRMTIKQTIIRKHIINFSTTEK